MFRLTLFLLVSASLFSGDLIFEVSAMESDLLVGLPVYIKVDIQNRSKHTLTIPKIRGTSIGTLGIAMCQNVFLSQGSREVTGDQFHLSGMNVDRDKIDLPTQAVEPGETVSFIFNPGTPRESGKYTFHINCNQLNSADTYERFRYWVKKPLDKGLTHSNRIIIDVKDPAGVDLEFYRCSPFTLHRDEMIETIARYPSSAYSLYYSVRRFSSPALTNDYPNYPINHERLCRYASERKSYYWLFVGSDRKSRKNYFRQKMEIEALDGVIREHSDSLYFIPLAHVLSQKLLYWGDFDRARKHLRKIIKSPVRLSQDKDLQISARRFLKCMDKYELTGNRHIPISDDQ